VPTAGAAPAAAATKKPRPKSVMFSPTATLFTDEPEGDATTAQASAAPKKAKDDSGATEKVASKGAKEPTPGTKLTASKAVEALLANASDLTNLDMSGSFTLTAQQACAIAEALERNTTVTELHMRGVRLTNQFATAAAKMLRVNHTLRVLDLEDNKIESQGIEEIGAALADNRGLVELTLLKNREPGENALAVLIKSFESNTTLQRINWRLTSRQSFTLTKKLSRNVEILRRKDAGMDYADIDPRRNGAAAGSPVVSRRETAAAVEADEPAPVRQATLKKTGSNLLDRVSAVLSDD
jgi:hypothetical protein